MVEQWLTPLGTRLVGATDIQPGQRVLDIAAGTGNASIPAAQRGADVVATDLTPELLVAGWSCALLPRASTLSGPSGRAEALPVRRRVVRRRDVRDRRDVRAPSPGGRRRARARVPPGRPGRRCSLGCPTGMLGSLFKLSWGRYAPTPPPGVQPPPLWGGEAHLLVAARRPRGDHAPRERDVLEVTAFVRAARLRRALQGQLRPDDHGSAANAEKEGAAPTSSTPTLDVFCEEWNVGNG